MKRPGYEPRGYRSSFKGEGLVFFDARVLQTDLRIGAVRDLREMAIASIVALRGELESYIRRQPAFLTALAPVDPLADAPEIAARMCAAAKAAGVGPMAAVAGAFAQLVGEALAAESPEAIVENGGDVWILSRKDRVAGIWTGPDSPFSGRLGVRVRADRTPMGLCTSSGTVGHSLSFGKADAAVVLAKDAFVADAAATAVGNRVKSPADIQAALDRGAAIEGVTGLVVLAGDRMGAWGDVELIELQLEEKD